MMAPVPYSASTKFATQIGTALAGERIDRRSPSVEALFLDGAGQASFAIEVAERLHLGAERGRVGAFAREPLDPGVLGREQDERRAVDGVDARRENLHRVGGAGDGELHSRAFRAADPVPLHDRDLVGPLGQGREIGEQFLGISSDAEEPLLEVALFDDRAAAPAALPSMTCSLARTVLSFGHQLTVERRR